MTRLRRHIRALVSIILIAIASLCSSCGGTRTDLVGEEPTIVAWYFEDLAHGIPRRPEELRLVGASARMTHIADWAEGSVIRGVREPPRPIKSRLGRLQLLSTMMSQGQVVVVAASGLLAPKRGLSADESEMVDPVVDAENHDRRSLDAVIMSMGDVQDREARAYLTAVRNARVQLDARSGASSWPPPAK